MIFAHGEGVLFSPLFLQNDYKNVTNLADGASGAKPHYNVALARYSEKGLAKSRYMKRKQ